MNYKATPNETIVSHLPFYMWADSLLPFTITMNLIINIYIHAKENNFH